MSCRVACALLLGGLLLSGCAGVSRRGAPVGDDAVATVPGFPAAIRWVGVTRRDFEQRTPDVLLRVREAAAGGPINVLALSGGGAGGAFGAGALVGMTQSGARPDFQIVTGVSAGALIAPLAFLGRAWDPALAEAFSGEQTQHLMRAHLMGALFGDSLYLGQPLTQLVDRYVTDELLRAVAAESRKGRLLIVAPNRRGMWALVESTPFGQGQPYSPGQIGRLLAATMFRVERRDSALYMPPANVRLVLRGAPAWERTGRWLAPQLAGVTLTEAVKDLYAAIPLKAAPRRRRLVLAEAA